MAITGTNVEIIVQGQCAVSSGGSKTVANVFHLTSTLQVGVVPTPLQIWTAFAANIWAPIAALLSVDYTGQQSTVRFMDDALLLPVTTTVPANGAVALPRNELYTTAVMLLRTALKGKSYRGSKHFAPLPEVQTLKDELAAGALVNWQAVLTAIQTPFVATTWTYICSIFSNHLSQSQVNPTTIVNTPLAATGRVNKTLGTMRRRKEKTNF